MDHHIFEDKAYEQAVGSYCEENNLEAISLNEITELSLNEAYSPDELRLFQSLDKLILNFAKFDNLDVLKELPHIRSIMLIDTSEIKNCSSLWHLESLEDLSIFGYKDEYCIGFLPLTNLRKLRSLCISENNEMKVSVAPLKYLESLEDLYLDEMNLTDTYALSALKKLKKLRLNSVNIHDISPLAELHHLESLSLSSNVISDLSPYREFASQKSLNYLDLSYNNISDISPFRDLEPSKKFVLLNLAHNEISDLSSIRELEAVKALDISYNPIDWSICSLRKFRFLRQIETLWLDKTYSSTADLEQAKKLISLSIRSNNIDNLKWVEGMCDLEELYIDHNPITDFSPLLTLPSLERVHYRSKNPNSGVRCLTESGKFFKDRLKGVYSRKELKK